MQQKKGRILLFRQRFKVYCRESDRGLKGTVVNMTEV